IEAVDRVWIEEAQRVSKRSIDILIPSIRAPGSEMWWTWNPDQPTDPVDEMFRGGDPPPHSLVRRVQASDNPWFPDVLRQEMEYDAQRDPDKHRHVWLGEYNTKSHALVFRNWRVEDFVAPADADHRFGADWGFAVDPTVLVRSHISGRTLYVDYEAWQIGCEVDHMPALFDRVPGVRGGVIRADSSRPEIVSYMRRMGFRIVPAIKGPGSVEDGIEWLRSHDIVVHPRCRHVIDELSTYAWRQDARTGEVLSILEDRANHTVDALRYAHEDARRAQLVKRAQPVAPAMKQTWTGRVKQRGYGDGQAWKTA
ncbi:MAG: terminase large subunit, partial [Chloracidobacterium sp.]